MDKVLEAYENLAITVGSAVYDAAAYGVLNISLDDIYNALDELAALYGMDLELAATAFREHNDLAAHADKLLGDELVLIRVVGTLSIGLAEIGSCIYDVDQSLRTPEVIGDMLGTVLVLSELEA
ncbi:exonuclease [Klebsiella phage P929]|nr:exonuclease [Klebsiella phage P929]